MDSICASNGENAQIYVNHSDLHVTPVMDADTEVSIILDSSEYSSSSQQTHPKIKSIYYSKF